MHKSEAQHSGHFAYRPGLPPLSSGLLQHHILSIGYISPLPYTPGIVDTLC